MGQAPAAKQVQGDCHLRRPQLQQQQAQGELHQGGGGHGDACRNLLPHHMQAQPRHQRRVCGVDLRAARRAVRQMRIRAACGVHRMQRPAGPVPRAGLSAAVRRQG